MEMRKIEWTGKNGNYIELRAFCETTMVDDIQDLDGYKINMGKKPYTKANLELWVDGKKADECWNTDFWQIIDLTNQPGYKKVWGLKLMMTNEQAEKVDAFMKSVIEDGKNAEVREAEAAEAEKERAEEIETAKSIIKAAENTIKNSDGTLMTNDQAKAWKKRYNDIHNEGGEGYIPRVITQEKYNWAQSILNR